MTDKKPKVYQEEVIDDGEARTHDRILAGLERMVESYKEWEKSQAEKPIEVKGDDKPPAEDKKD